MSVAVVLNCENALKLAELMELMPLDIVNEINEFNSDHADKWRQVMSSALRHVFCPSYFHAAEDEIYWQRTTLDWTAAELDNIFRCLDCQKRHEGPEAVLGAMRWQRMTRGINNMTFFYCDECLNERVKEAEEFQDESEWDDFDPNVDFEFNYDVDESAFDL